MSESSTDLCPVDLPAPAMLHGLGHALPAARLSRADTCERLARVWGLTGAARARWDRIVAGSGVDTRAMAVDVDQVPDLSTAERMVLFQRHSPPLGAQAAQDAMTRAGVGAEDVTDLVVVTCTGFGAPGLDTSLVQTLGLSPGTRRTTIGFMGCFGAVTGLRAAIGACAADPHAVVLVVCVELCTLHLRRDPAPDNQVASALFGDGAAAAVVAGTARDRVSGLGAPMGRLGLGASRLLPQGASWMTWTITDQGFAMTLDRAVPDALRQEVSSFLDDAALPRATIVLHPGGPGIIDAVDEALELGGGGGIEASRAVLRRCGNLSSGTLLVVLEETQRHGHPLPATMLAFGPGLSLEALTVHPADASGVR